MTGRITTRRARAAGCERVDGDIEIAQTDQGELTGTAFRTVAVVCTLNDIGDPRFRLWLVQALTPRMILSQTPDRQLAIKLEIIS